IDVDSLTHVINFDLPDVPETYVHRIGRTGRAGASGIALSFCDHEEIVNLKDINKLIGQKIPALGHPYEKMAEALATSPKDKSTTERRTGQWRDRNPRNVFRGN
ncbi:MAG: helicase-related protein, partial [Flavisolibacter sp.]